ncbi:hypothetical protein V8C37DRAFT_387536 [Trichoderma ceciliae]
MLFITAIFLWIHAGGIMVGKTLANHPHQSELQVLYLHVHVPTYIQPTVQSPFPTSTPSVEKRLELRTDHQIRTAMLY